MAWVRYWKNLSDLARLRLESLSKKGLPNIDPEMGGPLKQAGDYSTRQTPSKEARPVRLENNQTIWIEPGGAIREEGLGYRSLRVFEKASRSANAIIAALTASEADVIDPPKRVRWAVPLIERVEQEIPPEQFSGVHKTEEAVEILSRIMREPEFENATYNDVHPYVEHTLNYVKDLLRYYRPSFDDLPREEQIALMEHTVRHVNKFLESLRGLVEFAEYGTPSGQAKSAIKDAARDVRAAELKAVTQLSNPKLAQFMGVAMPEKWDIKNDPAALRQRIKRGTNLLERAFGKEGWQKQVKAMQEEDTRFQSLDEVSKWLESMASVHMEVDGVSLEEARVRVALYVGLKAEELGLPLEEAARIYAERGSLEGLEENVGSE